MFQKLDIQGFGFIFRHFGNSSMSRNHIFLELGCKGFQPRSDAPPVCVLLYETGKKILRMCTIIEKEIDELLSLFIVNFAGVFRVALWVRKFSNTTNIYSLEV